MEFGSPFKKGRKQKKNIRTRGRKEEASFWAAVNLLL
jgi:hypothetical protein